MRERRPLGAALRRRRRALGAAPLPAGPAGGRFPWGRVAEGGGELFVFSGTGEVPGPRSGGDGVELGAGGAAACGK